MWASETMTTKLVGSLPSFHVAKQRCHTTQTIRLAASFEASALLPGPAHTALTIAPRATP